MLTDDACSQEIHTSARPEVRGTADVGWRILFPLPLNPPRTHSRLYHHMCLWTDGQWRTWLERPGRCVAHNFCAVWGEGSAVCLGPRPASQRSPYTNYLRLGRWSTNRPLPMNDVSGRGVQSRSGIWTYLCTRQHWLWITVELHISGVRHGKAVAWEGGRHAPVRRVSSSEPLGLRTHKRRGQSRPLRSAVVEYQAPSVAVWLQLCARTGHASGYSRRPVMHGSPPAHRTPRPCLRTTGQIWHRTLFLQGAMTS